MVPMAAHTTEADPDANPSNKNAFFSNKGKVAGTFTAVGVVVLGIVSLLLYCCCCFGGSKRNEDNDGYTDEENQYSSDEVSMHHDEKIIARPPAIHSKHSSFSSVVLKRDNSFSGRSLLSYFTSDKDGGESHVRFSNNGHKGPTGSTGGAGINRNLSRKRLMSRRNSTRDLSTGSGSIGDGDIMFPIGEFDTHWDPNNMFMDYTQSFRSINDDHDYSRKLKVTNPDDESC
ncbi:uncharacterized protein LODBEIA_P12860 [Lodderomyces beijingensis]|uniref:Mid2 domain-containing protein n=1 Tax=Lodderomyces beijingensis TaxID=1775926 RepID=A0ABP0ZFW7_9ASCO